MPTPRPLFLKVPMLFAVAIQISGCFGSSATSPTNSYQTSSTSTPSSSYNSTTSPTTMYGSRNEVVSKIFMGSGSSCVNIADSASANFTVKHYKMTGITTTTPTAIGIATGTYYDAMVPGVTQICPGDQILVDVSIATATPPGNYLITVAGQSQSLHVWKSTLPTKPTLPLYSEITSNALLAGHELDPNSNVNVLGPLASSYVNELRAHRIEPIKQYLEVPAVQADGTLDLDSYSQYSGSFRDLVITGALAPVMFPTYFGSDASDRPTAAYLQGIQTAITANNLTNAWTYVWDEPTTSDYSEIDARTALIRQYAPSLKIMITSEQTSSLDIDQFFPVMDWFNQPGHVAASAYTNAHGLYGSCMSHGSCTNGTPAHLTGTPDLMLDDNPANFVAYPLSIYASGSKYGLYYDTVYSYGVTDPWQTQYEFGGNGDGNLFYPGRPGLHGITSNIPVDSYRMKMIRYGLNIIDYLALSGMSQSVVKDQFHWSANLSDYENLRITMGNYLDSH